MNWDYIIVGAGSAGCALAYELVRNAHRVLVIEAGGRDRSPFIKVAAGQVRACADHDWGYWSQPDPSRNGATEHWIGGRVLGGSSTINGTMFVRGAAADFDTWNVPGWSWEDVLPIFREYESSDQCSPLRGRLGPLHVRTVKRPHGITKAFVESACAVGYPFNPDYNAESQEGVGYAQLSQRRGLRCSAADAFLKPLLNKGNLRLLLNAVVEKVEVADGRAVAVSYLKDGRHNRAMADHIILCAGAINSPKLLMLSGIGNPEELRQHDIALVQALPGVGCNLREHPLIRMRYRTTSPTYNLTEGPLQKLSIVAKFLAGGEGPISNLFEGVAFVRSSSASSIPDVQIVFMAFNYVNESDGGPKLASYPSIMVLLIGSYPLSSGRIRLASSNPDDAPRIECRLLREQADVDIMVHGIRTVRRIMGANPIASHIDEEIAPGVHIEDPAALQSFVRSNTTIAFHPCGTCRMGMGSEAVVGPDLRVRGFENLWVADASIIPEPISGNLNAVCIMIGMKLGKHLTSLRNGSATH